MSRERKRRSPEQIVKALQEGEAMLAAGVRSLITLALDSTVPGGGWAGDRRSFCVRE